MTQIPDDIGPIHFIGIGGIGMSGIAELLISLDHQVQGSDQKESQITRRLRDLGAKIFIGHSEENIRGACVVVRSSAILLENPEFLAARSQHIPVIRRAEMLAELMRLRKCIAVAGTHGKTTTTSLIAAVLDKAGMDPTVVNGGIIRSYGSNARFGKGEWLIAEADESDGTFVKLPTTLAVVTNIDSEHLNHYGSFEALRDAFSDFLDNIPFYGAAICCVDHPEVQGLVARLLDRRIITYGLSRQADIRAENISYSVDGTNFDVVIQSRGQPQRWRNMSIPLPGEYNVLNALAAVAIGVHLNIEPEDIQKALAQFAGVARRFSKVGYWDGVTIIDDYGHHPVEIAAALKAAKQALPEGGRVIAIHEPHRYTRLESLFDEFCVCFNDADIVAIANVYPAGEDYIKGADRDALVAGIAAHGHRSVIAIDGPDEIPAFIEDEARPGDMVIFLGAGAISEWARGLEEKLNKLEGR